MDKKRIAEIQNFVLAGDLDAIAARIAALEAALGEAVEEIKFQFAEKQKLASEYYCPPLWNDVAKHNKVIVKIRKLLKGG